jgi:hypothetical protein
MTPVCDSAPGGVKRIMGILSEDLTAISAVDGTTKKYLSNAFTFETGKFFREFDFIKNSEGGKAGIEETDIGTPQSPAYETIVKFMVKGNSAINRDYLNQVRGTFRGVFALQLNNDAWMIVGTKESPAILRKLNRKFGDDLEAVNGQEVELYYKSAVGAVEFEGGYAQLIND